MERVISYEEIPRSNGESIYLRNETDPKLYVSLLKKGYKIVDDILEAVTSTIYVTGYRQIYGFRTQEDYALALDSEIQDTLKREGITKPKTIRFNVDDLYAYKYKLPFVLKNEKINGGREKFLIKTEEDYENLINSIKLLESDSLLLTAFNGKVKHLLVYNKILNSNYVVQEYIETPSKYNTTVRLLTTPSSDLLYGSLKYKEAVHGEDNNTLLSYLLRSVYPLSTPSIVSNTLSGGNNILIGASQYPNIEKALLKSHDINSSSFEHLIQAAKAVHQEYKASLGIICGFDFIYDREKEKWFMLEYHSKPMVGDYVKRQNILYANKEERLIADGRVRATALSLALRKNR